MARYLSRTLAERAQRFVTQKNAGIVYARRDPPFTYRIRSGWEEKSLLVAIAWDAVLGLKQSVAVIPDFGHADECRAMAKHLPELFQEFESTIYVEGRNVLTGNTLAMRDTPMSPRILIYTNRLIRPIAEVTEAFTHERLTIEVASEEELYFSTYIIYGGPDEAVAMKVQQFLKSQGVKTWLFSTDSIVGRKLHRTMWDGVNEYDRALLLASERSLNRAGVLNEIERVLEREAMEGGTSVLMPLALDDHIFGEWSPPRPDLAGQVRTRVIARLGSTNPESDEFQDAMQRVLSALRIG